MTSQKKNKEIAKLIVARFPIISVITHEEWRVLSELRNVRESVLEMRRAALLSQLENARLDQAVADGDHPEELSRQSAALEAELQALGEAHQVIRWSSTDGLMLVRWDDRGAPLLDPVDASSIFPPALLKEGAQPELNPIQVLVNLRIPPQKKLALVGQKQGLVDLRSAIYVFCDLHAWLDREDRAGRFNHTLVRAMRDFSYLSKNPAQPPSSLLLLSPRSVVPIELDKEVQIVDYPLPSEQEHTERFRARQPDFVAQFGVGCVSLNPDEESGLMKALSGLTEDEADNVLNKALVDHGRLGAGDISTVLEEKSQIIRKDGLLEYFRSDKDLTDVGGLERLLDWLEGRHRGFQNNGKVMLGEGDERREVQLPVPKGVLLIGVPGGGKSLTAKVIARAWSLPLLRIDIGRIFGGTVGQSEENMRRAIRVAGSVAPAVLWLDEVEKAFPKTTGASDAGTSLRVMNTFLTWLQEKGESVFVVATGNDIQQLPPELTRKGRFDEIFYLGLPGAKAREAILRIHTREIPGLSAADIAWLVTRSRYFTGAEIEQAVRDSLYRLSNDSVGEPGQGHSKVAQAISESMTYMVPLSSRVDEKGRRLLVQMLGQAESLGVPASDDFEALPAENAPAENAPATIRLAWPVRGRRQSGTT